MNDSDGVLVDETFGDPVREVPEAARWGSISLGRVALAHRQAHWMYLAKSLLLLSNTSKFRDSFRRCNSSPEKSSHSFYFD
jgi:hypothetical protein